MTTATAPTYRILVADDEQLVLEAYEKVFHADDPVGSLGNELKQLTDQLFQSGPFNAPGSKFEVVYCRQGEEAVSAVAKPQAQEKDFSVAFLDVRMPPGIDGITAAEKIRSIDPNLNIVVVTGFSDTAPQDIVRRVPPNDKIFYVQKPFQLGEIEQMAAALATKCQIQRDLENTIRALHNKCNELERTSAELSVAKEQVEASNRIKTDFIANMSHELRTPINAIIGFTELVHSEKFGPLGCEKYREYLSDVIISAKHLLGIINSVLDFSRIELGALPIVERMMDLSETTEEMVQFFRLQARHAGINLCVSMPDKPLLVRSDERRVRQILLNLLSNAMKFTPSGGKIVVSLARTDDGDFEFSVTDNGVGMTESQIATALLPFGQIAPVLTREHGGTGLGLPLTKRLAEVLGGSFVIASEQGNGTNVTVRLPGKPRHDAQGVVATSARLRA